MRRRACTLLGLGLLTACPKLDERSGRVLLGVRDDAAGCYRACGTSTWQGYDDDTPEPLFLPKLWCPDQVPGAAADDPCGLLWDDVVTEPCPELEAGGARLLVATDFGPDPFTLAHRAQPDLAFVFDLANVFDAETSDDWRESCGHGLTLAERTVPPVPADDAHVRVSYRDHLELVSDTVPIGDAIVDVTCLPDPATLAVGVEPLTIGVCAPDVSAATITLSDVLEPSGETFTRTNELSLAAPVSDDRCPPNKRFGTTALLPPDRPGSTWRVRVRVNEWSGISDCAVRLETAEALAVEIEPAHDLDCDGPARGVFPRRTAQERSPECRELRVNVGSSARPSDGRYTVEVDAGALPDGSEASLPARATGMGRAHAAATTWTLPSNPEASNDVSLVATAMGFPGNGVNARLEPVLPRPRGLLFAPPQSVVQVGPSGSAGLPIHAALELVPGTELVDFDELAIVVRATPDPDARLTCGPVVDVIAINCDRDDLVPGLAGGCALTPTRPQAGTDGEFDFTLLNGICFAGTIELELHARTYTDDAESCPCLGHAPVEPKPIKLASLALTYVPAPIDPDG